MSINAFSYQIWYAVGNPTQNDPFQRIDGLGLVGERGWPTDLVERAQWIELDAERGVGEAQALLYRAYVESYGVPEDFEAATYWLSRSAEQGVPISQALLGIRYIGGDGVEKDIVVGHVWLNLAVARLPASKIRRSVLGLRDKVADSLEREELAEAQRLASTWRPSTPEIETESVSVGTGFVVSREGYLLTNQHVVAGCDVVSVAVGQAKDRGHVVFADARNDLALVKVARRLETVATFRGGSGIRPGDPVVAVGFPLAGLLASAANVSTGTISALAGPGNDARLLQMSAPIQPGNSGGPLLDGSGNIVGVVVSKLGVEIALVTGDIPQNVNFAVNAEVARQFLNAAGIAPQTAESNVDLWPADVAALARDFTALVECRQ